MITRHAGRFGPLGSVGPPLRAGVVFLAVLALGAPGIAASHERAGAVTVAGNCAPSGAGTTCTFAYNGTNGTDGHPQTYTVPVGITSVIVEAWGAQGGGPSGGLGGHAKATFAVAPGDVLNVRVGGRPTGAAGGFNGGGAGATDAPGGGGASDVRLGGDTLAARVLVAGGGGGEGVITFSGVTNAVAGGNGGGGAGTTGDQRLCSLTTCGGGGTASAGGAGAPSSCGDLTTQTTTPGTGGVLGQGGAGGSATCAFSGGSGSVSEGGGGGGGRYGGGGGGTSLSLGIRGNVNLLGTPGGGGSGFVASTATGPLDETGVHTGHGLVTITSNAPVTYSSSYRASEAPWLYADAVFLHQPNLALVQRDATMFLVSLGTVIEANHSSPPALGPNTAPGPLTFTTSYTDSEDATLRHTATLFATDVPGLQRHGVQLLAFLIAISR